MVPLQTKFNRLILAKYTKEFKYNWKLAAPVMLGMLGHTFVSFIDNIMVGQLGTAELAAVSLGNSFMFIAMSIGIGFSPGDRNNPEPYFYVTMWPYPDLNNIALPDISIGNWNTENWIGASLAVSELIKTNDEHKQCEIVLSFIKNSVSVVKETLVNNK